VHFDTRYEDIVPAGRLIYGDFMVPGADPRVYKQITDMDKLVKVSGSLPGVQSVYMPRVYKQITNMDKLVKVSGSLPGVQSVLAGPRLGASWPRWGLCLGFAMPACLCARDHFSNMEPA